MNTIIKKIKMIKIAAFPKKIPFTRIEQSVNPYLGFGLGTKAQDREKIEYAKALLAKAKADAEKLKPNPFDKLRKLPPLDKKANMELTKIAISEGLLRKAIASGTRKAGELYTERGAYPSFLKPTIQVQKFQKRLEQMIKKRGGSIEQVKQAAFIDELEKMALSKELLMRAESIAANKADELFNQKKYLKFLKPQLQSIKFHNRVQKMKGINPHRDTINPEEFLAKLLKKGQITKTSSDKGADVNYEQIKQAAFKDELEKISGAGILSKLKSGIKQYIHNSNLKSLPSDLYGLGKVGVPHKDVIERLSKVPQKHLRMVIDKMPVENNPYDKSKIWQKVIKPEFRKD
jgi:hypothetical protein